MGRPCLVCSSADRAAIDTAITGGASDYQVAAQFGIERVSVGRHRRRHVLKAAQDRLAIVSKGADARRERQELAAALDADEPPVEQLVQAAVGTRALLRKLDAIEGRLQRM